MGTHAGVNSSGVAELMEYFEMPSVAKLTKTSSLEVKPAGLSNGRAAVAVIGDVQAS